MEISRIGENNPIKAALPKSVQTIAEPSGGTFKTLLQDIADRWSAVEEKSAQTFTHLPNPLQGYLRLQVSVNNLGLQVNLLSKATEAFSGSVRQLQQGSTA